ncbi:MAG TPA: DUF4956 domain-containing protein [Planctomycetota bacterium]|nr:DUF4956 domain-containing protein [Planctomycetota bacterium]
MTAAALQQGNTLLPTGGAENLTHLDVLVNLTLALVLGLVLAQVYRGTHKGLSYSQSFTVTIVFVTVIVAAVMMVIGGSIARAFALVGALSIVRFRTVVKDTKDTAYIFAGLAAGMAAGTNLYFLAGATAVFFSIVAVVLHRTNFGALYKTEFVLRFVFDQNYGSEGYLAKLQEYAKRANLLHIEPSSDGKYLSLTYDVNLREGVSADQFARAFGQVEGTSQVTLIAAKNDVDF